LGPSSAESAISLAPGVTSTRDVAFPRLRISDKRRKKRKSWKGRRGEERRKGERERCLRQGQGAKDSLGH